jgi:DNA-binding response OmpR family regulator
MIIVKPTSQSRHILVVDGDYNESHHLADALRGKSYRVSIAYTGEQGCKRAMADAPDLVLLSGRMPDIDSLAVCSMLKASPSLADIPVILLGAASDALERLNALKTGVVDYILRPYTPEDVLAKVHLHLPSKKTPAAARPPTRYKTARLDDDEDLVRRAQLYMAEHLSETPSLGRMAKILGVNEKRLSRAFHKCLGETVFGYLRRVRMLTAQRLLEATGLTIVSISEEVGFSQPANFSTAFRAYTGVSPSEFRKSVSLNRDVIPHLIRQFTDSKD